MNCVEDGTELVFDNRAFLTGIENSDQPFRAQSFDQVDHHSDPALHVSGAETVESITVDTHSGLALERDSVHVPDEKDLARSRITNDD
jgi:hypothetical protein